MRFHHVFDGYAFIAESVTADFRELVDGYASPGSVV
jgi:hypothetical protein